jgi:hypothetical protein
MLSAAMAVFWFRRSVWRSAARAVAGFAIARLAVTWVARLPVLFAVPARAVADGAFASAGAWVARASAPRRGCLRRARFATRTRFAAMARLAAMSTMTFAVACTCAAAVAFVGRATALV